MGWTGILVQREQKSITRNLHALLIENITTRREVGLELDKYRRGEVGMELIE